MGYQELPYQFTTYNLVAFAACLVFKPSEALKDIVRTTSWLVLLASLFIHLAHGHTAALDIYTSLAEFPGKHWLLYPVDLVLHWVPALVLGFPKHSQSVLVGTTILAAWYLIVRNKMQSLYSSHLSAAQYDNTMASVLVAGLAIAAWRSIETQKVI